MSRVLRFDRRRILQNGSLEMELLNGRSNASPLYLFVHYFFELNTLLTFLNVVNHQGGTQIYHLIFQVPGGMSTL